MQEFPPKIYLRHFTGIIIPNCMQKIESEYTVLAFYTVLDKIGNALTEITHKGRWMGVKL